MKSIKRKISEKHHHLLFDVLTETIFVSMNQKHENNSMTLKHF
jgi:hypothetical protein